MVIEHEKEITESFKELEGYAAKMREVLNDHLARESHAEKTRTMASIHADKFIQLEQWMAASDSYLNTWPEVYFSDRSCFGQFLTPDSLFQ